MPHPAVGLSGFGVYGVAANIALPCVGADACIRPGRLRRGGVPGPISGLRAGPCGPVGLRNAPAGAVQASSPTEVCYNAGTAVSRLAMGPPLVVGEGFIPPAGVRGGAGFAGGACPSPTRLPATTGHMGRPDARPAENPL